MTFDEIVAEVMDRLNLTSDSATTRVGREVNDRYRRLTSSIGLETSRKIVADGIATIGSRYITFSGIEKLFNVIDRSSGKDILLDEMTVDEMHAAPLVTQPPHNYAINRMGATSVEIYVDCVPTTGFTLYGDAMGNVVNMQDVDEPEIPESFHDILVFGAMADEYRKMEKVQLMSDAESNYERRLSDLRMWIAKSGYLDIYQSKTNIKKFWWNS